MHKIDGAGHVNGEFVVEDLALNRPPTEITAEWLNTIQNEISNVITGAGIALDKDSNTQLALAILNMITTQVTRASALDAQGLMDTSKLITPSTLNEAFKGSNQSLLSTPFQRFPGGLILQFGVTGTIAKDGTQTITLPVTYPILCRTVLTSPANGALASGASSSGIAVSSGQITVANTSSASTPFAIYWLTLGY